MNRWYQFTRGTLSLYVRLFMRNVVMLGKANIKPGAKIIVANHPNATDAFAFLPTLKEHLHFAIMGDLVTLPIIGPILKRAEQIPTYRKQAERFVQDATKYLNKGEPVVIFPEGKLSINNGIRKAGLGAAMLAAQSQAPILPVGIHVPFEHIRVIKSRFYGRNTIGSWQFGGRIYLNFGAAFQLPAISQGDMRKIYQKNTQIIMDRIHELAEEARQFSLQFAGNQSGLASIPDAPQQIDL